MAMDSRIKPANDDSLLLVMAGLDPAIGAPVAAGGIGPSMRRDSRVKPANDASTLARTGPRMTI